MKKYYQQPTMIVVKIQHSGIIYLSNGDTVSCIDNNASLDYGGAGTGSARTKSYSIWDDEW